MNQDNWAGGMRGAAGRLRAAAIVTALGSVVLLGSAAMGQEAQPEPLDVNAVKSAPPAAAVDAAAPAPAGQPAKTEETPAAAAPVVETQTYQISAFRLEYAALTPEEAAGLGLPTLEELSSSVADLAISGDAYAAPAQGLSTVQMRVNGLSEAGGGKFYWSGIGKVAEAIVRKLNDRGIIACFVEVPGIESDKADAREGNTEMLLKVWVGRVGENGIRSIGSGERLSESDTRVNPSDPIHQRIRANSPSQPGTVLNQNSIDDYVYRLNRHPGRRVDVSLAPGEKEGEVVLDYLVSENKPWSIYTQLSNTGTEATNEWRERFGFIHNQLTGNDDILKLDYITGGFDASHAVSASYEFPLFGDRIRMRPYANWSEFEASDVGSGIGGQDFSGTAWSGGLEAVGNVYQKGQFFLDVFGGTRYEWTEIVSPTETGEAEFWIPYIGLRAERITDASLLVGSLSYEASVNDWTDDAAGTGDLNAMGRPDVNEYWQMVKWDSEFSFYLEPLIYDRDWRGEASTKKGRKSLAHELGFTFRGQYSPGDRFIPNEEEVAGGLYSVRGYSESVTAGDTVLIASMEYRFHLPRVLGFSDAVEGSPYWQPGHVGSQGAGMFGDNFRWAPQSDFGRADWDLIFRAFLDGASVFTVRAKTGEDTYNTLLGTGVGVELQIKRNFIARLDWGLALHDVDDITGGEEVITGAESGDTQLHFSATLLY